MTERGDLNLNSTKHGAPQKFFDELSAEYLFQAAGCLFTAVWFAGCPRPATATRMFPCDERSIRVAFPFAPKRI